MMVQFAPSAQGAATCVDADSGSSVDYETLRIVDMRGNTAEGLYHPDIAGTATAPRAGEPNQEAVRGARLKWLIFGVLIPLLPVGARLAAAWLDGRGTSGFSGLFGDGELLVLATVVAAASIGDVLFSFRRGPWGAKRLRTAIITAAALMVVVLAVLLFGLVTYANQTQVDTQSTAQKQEVKQVLTEASIRSAEARAEASHARKLEDMLVREISGALSHGSSGVSGERRLAARVKTEIEASQQQRVRLERAASRLQTQAEIEQRKAQSQVHTSTSELKRGRHRAALISVAIFIASLFIAFSAISLGSPEQHEAAS